MVEAGSKEVIVYLNDREHDVTEHNNKAYDRHRMLGGLWDAHFIGYKTGEATSWTRHERELGEQIALTPDQIVQATENAIKERLCIEHVDARYLMPSVGTTSGVELGTR